MSIAIKKRNSKIRFSYSDRIFNFMNIVFWIIILAIMLYPLYLIILASLSEPEAVISGQVIFKAVNPSIAGYKAVFRYQSLLHSYMNSIIYTVSGTALSIAVTLMAAYALSRPKFPGKGFVNMFLVVTMFFNGGLIPTFIVMKNIGLYNNPLILILTGCVSVWNLMVARTYIQTTIPNELYEAAMIDGASHFTYFFKIVLPLCSTIIAVLCIYYGVGKWNDFFTALVYIRDRAYLPLQTILRDILASLRVDANPDFMAAMADDPNKLQEALRTAQVAKYCIIVVSTGPVVLLYILMQKYFVKGVMIGSIKG